MRTFLLLPVWALTKLIVPFLPKDHPFHEDSSLKTWKTDATDEAVTFGTLFWLFGSMALFGLFTLYVRR